MNVKVEEQRLSAAGEGILRSVENQLLRHLLELLFVHADEERGIQDVDVGDAERAGIVGLH